MDIVFLPSKAATITVKVRTGDAMLLIQCYQNTALRFLADSYLYPRTAGFRPSFTHETLKCPTKPEHKACHRAMRLLQYIYT